MPEELGGAGLDYVSYALIVEELCRGDASVGITMWAHNSLCTNHIASFASPALKQKYLPDLVSGRVLGAWGLTEPGSARRGRLATRAELRDGHWVLNGSKAFITNGSVGSTAVVMARTDPERKTRGISAFILDKSTPGFIRGKPYRKLGLHASDTAEMIFEDARSRPRTSSASGATASSRRCRCSRADGSRWRPWASASPRRRSTRRSST